MYAQFRKDYIEPYGIFRWYHTEFFSCKMLGKNLHSSKRQVQTGTYGRVHLVRAYMMSDHAVTLQNKNGLFGHIYIG